MFHLQQMRIEPHGNESYQWRFSWNSQMRCHYDGQEFETMYILKTQFNTTDGGACLV